MSTITRHSPSLNLSSRRRMLIQFGVVILVLAGLSMSALAGLVYPRLAPLIAGREWWVLAAVLVAWPLLLLCVIKYDWMVFVAFCLFAVVRIEPAPVDVLLLLLLGLGVATGKLSFGALRGTPLVHLAIWLFLMVNMLSLLVGSAANLRFMVITLYMVGIFYFIKMYVTSEAAMRIVMFGYLTSALLSVGLLALDYTGIGPGGIFVVNNRAKALFKDANVFGPFLVIVILYLIDEIWRPYMIRRFQILKLVAVAALAAGLFLSFSRAAWGNLVIALAIYGLLNLKQITGKIVARGLLLGALGILALAVIVNVTGLQDFLRWRATAVQNYDFDRLAAQQEAVRQGFANLLGLGPGMMDIGFYSPHSLYARSFGEHGILGFVAIALLLGALLLPAFTRAVRVTDRVYGLAPNVVFASAVGLLFNSFVIDTLHWRHFWFLLALLWILAAYRTTVNAANNEGRSHIFGAGSLNEYQA